MDIYRKSSLPLERLSHLSKVTEVIFAPSRSICVTSGRIFGELRALESDSRNSEMCGIDTAEKSSIKNRCESMRKVRSKDDVPNGHVGFWFVGSKPHRSWRMGENDLPDNRKDKRSRQRRFDATHKLLLCQRKNVAGGALRQNHRLERSNWRRTHELLPKYYLSSYIHCHIPYMFCIFTPRNLFCFAGNKLIAIIIIFF